MWRILSTRLSSKSPEQLAKGVISDDVSEIGGVSLSKPTLVIINIAS